jgi:uncharacterized protein (TIGR02996 family)
MNKEAFLQDILADPDNATATWLVLADWLDEQGDPRAELIRLVHGPQSAANPPPGQREARIRELLMDRVWPCVPVVVNSIGMPLVFIPPGRFVMGSPETEANRFATEGPLHKVELTRPFLVGAGPVTQEEYRRVMGSNPSRFHRRGKSKTDPDQRPVEGVSWPDATQFCERLSRLSAEQADGRTYRLPTEAEWEYACRAGARDQTPYHFGFFLSSATQVNFDGVYGRDRDRKERYRKVTTPVCTFPPNAFGLFDMHGNVWEWCNDWFGEDYYRKSPRQDPQGPETGDRRVQRGGCWDCVEWACRTAYRVGERPDDASSYNGMRVVCDLLSAGRQ